MQIDILVENEKQVMGGELQRRPGDHHHCLHMAGQAVQVAAHC